MNWIDYYLTFHILVGYYLVDWIYSYLDKWAKQVGRDFKPDNVREVLAVFVLWPIVIPIALIIKFWHNHTQSQ